MNWAAGRVLSLLAYFLVVKGALTVIAWVPGLRDVVLSVDSDQASSLTWSPVGVVGAVVAVGYLGFGSRFEQRIRDFTGKRWRTSWVVGERVAWVLVSTITFSALFALTSHTQVTVASWLTAIAIGTVWSFRFTYEFDPDNIGAREMRRALGNGSRIKPGTVWRSRVGEGESLILVSRVGRSTVNGLEIVYDDRSQDRRYVPAPHRLLACDSWLRTDASTSVPIKSLYRYVTSADKACIEEVSRRIRA